MPTLATVEESFCRSRSRSLPATPDLYRAGTVSAWEELTKIPCGSRRLRARRAIAPREEATARWEDRESEGRGRASARAQTAILPGSEI